jgi:hypothetical protein
MQLLWSRLCFADFQKLHSPRTDIHAGFRAYAASVEQTVPPRYPEAAYHVYTYTQPGHVRAGHGR